MTAAAPPFPRSVSWPRSSLALSTLLASIAYIGFSVLLTWPVAINPTSVLFGDFGDTRGWAWDLWARSRGLLDAATTTLLAAPFGIETTQGFRQPIAEGIPLAFAKVFGEIAAINLFVLIAFPLTALATFHVLARLTGDRLAAFAGGLIFGFCPAAVMQAAGGHVSYAFNPFVPLFVLALLRNAEERSTQSSLWVGLAYAAIALTSLYVAYYALFLALFFAAFDIASARAVPRRFLLNYLSCGAIAVAIVLPFELPAVWEQLTQSREALSSRGLIRGISDLHAFAARPWNYLVPPMDHPLFGQRVGSFVRANLHGGNAFEQTLYVGFIPIALVMWGIVLACRGHCIGHEKRLLLLSVTGTFVLYLLSLPPTVGGVPTPSALAYDIAPMFRVYARAGLLVAFFLSFAACVALAIVRRCLGAFARIGVTALVLAGIAVEYWTLPPGHARPLESVPPVYQWLKRQPAGTVVAEYPMFRSDEAAAYSYLYWQRVHGKALVNGAPPGKDPAWAFFERVRDLSSHDAPALLKSAGVKYVILHQRQYREGPIPSPIKRYYSTTRASLSENGGVPPPIPYALRPHLTFGSDHVFTIED